MAPTTRCGSRWPHPVVKMLPPTPRTRSRNAPETSIGSSSCREHKCQGRREVAPVEPPQPPLDDRGLERPAGRVGAPFQIRRCLRRQSPRTPPRAKDHDGDQPISATKAASPTDLADHRTIQRSATKQPRPTSSIEPDDVDVCDSVASPCGSTAGYPSRHQPEDAMREQTPEVDRQRSRRRRTTSHRSTLATTA